jgi:hypothetical protein
VCGIVADQILIQQREGSEHSKLRACHKSGGRSLSGLQHAALSFVTQSHSPERHQADSVYFWLEYASICSVWSSGQAFPINRRPLTLSRLL